MAPSTQRHLLLAFCVEFVFLVHADVDLSIGVDRLQGTKSINVLQQLVHRVFQLNAFIGLREEVHAWNAACAGTLAELRWLTA